ncbi:MAG: right-handed parallel beta-helix repeat-containing protein [Verrucomicrobia bacterium]|nr:right-handed parallel beta-helix repeat-containing protein [Verrucomicrobiota bacterium]MBS0636645.1 right-handed parallel beta-helix repeat-containing protein [Verrucomicrobiota bacterium]
MMSKIIFVACLAAFACASTLHAAEEKKAYLTKLEQALPEFRKLAKKAKSNKNRIAQILRHAEHVVYDSAELTPDAIRMAIEAVAMAKNELQAEGRGHWTSSSSSSSSCDACDELSELGSDVSECCNEITTLLMQVQRLLADEFPCDASIAIDSVPLTITESGKYCVTSDLTYDGTGAAITVLANNVTINFHNHSLTLTNEAAQGILAQNVSEFTLENDVIQGAASFISDTSVAVHLDGVHKAHLNNVYTYNTTKGIHLYNCNDVLVDNALIRAHDGTFNLSDGRGAGIFIQLSEGVTVENVFFEGSGAEPDIDAISYGVWVRESENVMVKDSSFDDWLLGIYGQAVTGLTIDHCMIKASPYSGYSTIQLGSTSTPEFVATDVIIRDTTLEQPTFVPFFDGMLLAHGSGLMMENVVLDVTTGTEVGSGYIAGAIHAGYAANSSSSDNFIFSDIYARNCIVRGANQYGLYVELGRDIIFSHSQFTDASLANVFISNGGILEGLSTQGCQIVDSLIADGLAEESFGVYIEFNTASNAIMNNQINNHSAAAIYIESSAPANQIKGNRIFGNYDGIYNTSITSDIYYNTSCNNSNSNCIGVGVTQNPTDSPVVAGSNICCVID